VKREEELLVIWVIAAWSPILVRGQLSKKQRIYSRHSKLLHRCENNPQGIDLVVQYRHQNNNPI
jgi:hypothetical protein